MKKICQYTDKCPMYAEFRSQTALDIFKKLYCDNSFEECERYKIRITGGTPPDALLPNGDTLMKKS